MRSAMPLFIIFKNKVQLGTVSAVSYAQAHKRAVAIYGRCEVVAKGNVAMDKRGREADSFTHGRTPYPTPGFDERRAALIAALGEAE